MLVSVSKFCKDGTPYTHCFVCFVDVDVDVDLYCTFVGVCARVYVCVVEYLLSSYF